MDRQTSDSVKEITGQRQSDRIRYAYSIRILATDSSGLVVEEGARTDVITRDGGMLVTHLSLSTGVRILIKRGERQVEARIVGQCGIRNEENLFGFQFADPSLQDFWDVKFPPLVPDSVVGRAVLQCSRCSRQEVLHLGETEMMVRESMQMIPHHCEHCDSETLWVEPQVVGEKGVIIGSGSYEVQSSAPPRRQKTINDRKYARISMKNAKACLHRPGFADDIVSVIDISRGGIRFLSLVDYQPNTRLEVAVPYTSGGANVFTPARVARVQCRPTADIPGDFGLEYVKK